MVSTDMLLELDKIYYECYTGKIYKRQKLKIVVDSIMEQLCGHYLNSRPISQRVSDLNTRKSILTKINEITADEDKKVLLAFNYMLREYEETFSKTYADHSRNFQNFINKELRDLTIALITHSSYINDEYAGSLRRLLL